jgi:hypothetical protein
MKRMKKNTIHRRVIKKEMPFQLLKDHLIRERAKYIAKIQKTEARRRIIVRRGVVICRNGGKSFFHSLSFNEVNIQRAGRRER